MEVSVYPNAVETAGNMGAMQPKAPAPVLAPGGISQMVDAPGTTQQLAIAMAQAAQQQVMRGPDALAMQVTYGSQGQPYLPNQTPLNAGAALNGTRGALPFTPGAASLMATSMGASAPLYGFGGGMPLAVGQPEAVERTVSPINRNRIEVPVNQAGEVTGGMPRAMMQGVAEERGIPAFGNAAAIQKARAMRG